MADGCAIAGVRLATPIVGDFVYLAQNMRDDEIAQWLALTGAADYNPDLCARGFLALTGPAFVLVGPDNLPVVAGGFEPIRPGVYQTWMAGTTAGWAKHWKAITRHSRRLVDGMLRDGVAQRVQTYALASRTAAHTWYERGLGQTFEGVHRSFFADGQDAVCYARIVEDVTHGR